MAGLGDEIAAGAGGRGRLRASHADREQVIEVLKAGFVHGRLDRDEFDLRVGQAFVARTYADLDLLRWAPASTAVVLVETRSCGYGMTSWNTVRPDRPQGARPKR